VALWNRGGDSLWEWSGSQLFHAAVENAIKIETVATAAGNINDMFHSRWESQSVT
jgi:hypothetical protein